MSKDIMLDPQSIIKRSTDVLASEVEGEVVMMSIDKGKYFGLDKVGGDIWNKIEEPKSISSLCDELEKEYKANREQIELDLYPFIQDLINNGIIELDH